MAFKGQTGVSCSIERPRTAKQKKDAESRRKATRRKLEYFIQYKCVKCNRENEDRVIGADASFCIYCYIEGNGLNKVEETKGRRMKSSTQHSKSTKNSKYTDKKKPKYKKKRP